MSYKENIAEISAKIDMCLEKERQTGEYVSNRLHEYVRELLYTSYITARDEMEVGIGGGIMEIGLIIAWKALSNDEMVDYTVEAGNDRISSQKDLNKKWRLIPETIRNKKTDELLDILEINKQGFEKTLVCLEII